MKVGFLNPPWFERDGSEWRIGVRAGSRWPFTFKGRSAPDRWTWGDYTPYPFFLGYSAAALAAEPGVEVHFRDSIATRESYTRFYVAVRAERFDYVVMESATPSWPHDAQLIEKLAPAKVILAGPIASKADAILANYPVHAVVHGEYERGVRRVVCDGASGEVGYDLLSEEAMNAAPPPWLDAKHAQRYWDPCPAGQKHPQAHVWTSRGCWAKCIFCVFPAVMVSNDPDGTKKRTVRHYHAPYMLPYLKGLVERYRFASFWVDDDLFNTSERHVLEMCEVFKAVGKPWSAMCRADGTKPETWQAMKDAGCFAVKLGFESASQRVLDEIVNKRLDLGEAYETLRLLKSIGLTVHTTWTVGLPGELKDEQQQTLDTIQRLYKEGLHATHQCSGTASIEGTPMHNLLQLGTLKKYPGAKADENYLLLADGAKKGAAVQEALKA